MGSQSSTSQNRNANLHKFEALSSFNANKETYSKYFGIKSQYEDEMQTEKILKTNNNHNYSTNSRTNDDDSYFGSQAFSLDSDLKLEQVKVEFDWTHGGNQIYITGSFANWEQWFLMNKEENGPHRLTMVYF